MVPKTNLKGAFRGICSWISGNSNIFFPIIKMNSLREACPETAVQRLEEGIGRELSLAAGARLQGMKLAGRTSVN
jgi:hypothetical protein